MQKLHYSNVCIPKDTDWKREVAELLEGVDVSFRLVNKTKSGNFIVQLSAPDKVGIRKVLHRAIDKY